MEKRRSGSVDGRFYTPPNMHSWHGRLDGTDSKALRWHQHVQRLDLRESAVKVAGHGSVVILGFACEEGVKLNQGRVGAAKGPDAIRRALCNLPVFQSGLAIYDAGDVHCPDGSLEMAQQQLAAAASTILQLGAFPILLGGGHEITYGHFLGIRQFLGDNAMPRIGIVNFDAHFDNREPTQRGATSGTGFWQIAHDCMENGLRFNYLALGIQKTSNTPLLFETAQRTGTQYALAEHFHDWRNELPTQLIDALSLTAERLYITIDLDVFAAPYAPGVSAPAYNGILPDVRFFDCLDRLFDTGKVLSLDIAELNPAMDLDGRTAKLAAAIIFHVVERLAGMVR